MEIPLRPSLDDCFRVRIPHLGQFRQFYLDKYQLLFVWVFRECLPGEGEVVKQADMKACSGSIGRSIQGLWPVPTASIDRRLTPFGADRGYFFLPE